MNESESKEKKSTNSKKEVVYVQPEIVKLGSLTELTKDLSEMSDAPGAPTPSG